jgi:uncharacterized protein (DUF1330 family)
MAAYLIVEHIITDPAKFEEYRTKAGPMIAKYGWRYLTKGGSHKMPEGGHWKPERVVIVAASPSRRKIGNGSQPADVATTYVERVRARLVTEGDALEFAR